MPHLTNIQELLKNAIFLYEGARSPQQPWKIHKGRGSLSIRLRSGGDWDCCHLAALSDGHLLLVLHEQEEEQGRPDTDSKEQF